MPVFFFLDPKVSPHSSNLSPIYFSSLFFLNECCLLPFLLLCQLLEDPKMDRIKVSYPLFFLLYSITCFPLLSPLVRQSLFSLSFFLSLSPSLSLFQFLFIIIPVLQEVTLSYTFFQSSDWDEDDDEVHYYSRFSFMNSFASPFASPPTSLPPTLLHQQGGQPYPVNSHTRYLTRGTLLEYKYPLPYIHVHEISFQDFVPAIVFPLYLRLLEGLVEFSRMRLLLGGSKANRSSQIARGESKAPTIQSWGIITGVACVIFGTKAAFHGTAEPLVAIEACSSDEEVRGNKRLLRCWLLCGKS